MISSRKATRLAMATAQSGGSSIRQRLISCKIRGNVGIEDCTSGSQSIGNGYAGNGGVLKIGGNFTCTGNTSFLCSAELGSVGGNVQVDDNFSARVSGNKIGGNLEVNDNGLGVTAVTGNTVGGNGEVDGNEPGSSATGNTIGGNLTCTGNAGGFGGAGNTVHGKYLPSPGSQCS